MLVLPVVNACYIMWLFIVLAERQVSACRKTVGSSSYFRNHAEAQASDVFGQGYGQGTLQQTMSGV